MNKNLIINLASKVWNEAPYCSVEDNNITVYTEKGGNPIYTITIEGEAVVKVKMEKGNNYLDLRDLWFINLIDENASEISKIEEN